MTDTATEESFDFSDVAESTEAAAGPLTGTRGTGNAPRTGVRRRRSSTKKLDALQAKLSSEMFQAGTLIGMGLNTTGYYICQESDGFTKAVVQLAARRPEWVDALEHLADVQPGIVIGRTMFGIGASLAVDRGRADPEKQFMKFLGVYSAWKAVHDNAPIPAEGSNYTPPPAGAFVPVG